MITILFLLSLSDFSSAWPGFVVSITDGDTLRVETMDGIVEIIRLYGVDAPELANRRRPCQPGAEEAKQFLLETLPPGTIVEVRQDQSWRNWGRLVATLILEDGTELNRILLSQGLAWFSPDYCTKPFCVEWRLEHDEARLFNRGLWAEDLVTEPWTWRKLVFD